MISNSLSNSLSCNSKEYEDSESIHERISKYTPNFVKSVSLKHLEEPSSEKSINSHNNYTPKTWANYFKEPLNQPRNPEIIKLSPIENKDFNCLQEKINNYIGYTKDYGFFQSNTPNLEVKNFFEQVQQTVNSIELIGSLPKDDLIKWATQRDIYNIGMVLFSSPDENKNSLSCETSYIRSKLNAKKQEEILDPKHRLSLAMLATVYNTKHEPLVTEVPILSVAAPALDSSDQPEYNLYVDTNGNLKTKEYEDALQTIAEHVKLYARQHLGKEVVFPAVGMSAFLGALMASEQQKAKSIFVDVFTKMTIELEEQGNKISLFRSDESTQINSKRSQKVNKKNKPYDQLIIRGYLDANNLSWIDNNKIIINAWDPHSLVGNGCSQDNSLDGWIGRLTNVHPAHALFCMAHNNKEKLNKS